MTTNSQTTEGAQIATLVSQARTALAVAEKYDQERADLLCAAAAWAILEPARNRTLAEMAVRETGLGNVADKIQ